MPGERIDLWADFSQLAGQQVVLRSLPFTPGGMMGMMGNGMMGGGMMGGMMGSGLPNGSALDILAVNVGKTASTSPVLGTLPALSVKYSSSNTVGYSTPYPVVLSMGHMMAWMLNGRVYQENVVADDEVVYKDEVTAWEWINNSPIPHPMHIHNAQFQVLQRSAENAASSYAEINQGLVDNGWKDTVLVWPGERVKVAIRFGPDTGMFMYHCHILEHEDMTMMRNFMIRDSRSSNSGM
jgi:blue copper oxidase